MFYTKAIFIEQERYDLTHSRKDNRIYIFPKGINQKVNGKWRLNFELINRCHSPAFNLQLNRDSPNYDLKIFLSNSKLRYFVLKFFTQYYHNIKRLFTCKTHHFNTKNELKNN